MRAPTILRSLPLRQLQPRVAVAPLPEKTRFDRELTAELDTTLQSQGEHSIGLAQLLDAAITAQKIALDSLVNTSYRDDADRRGVEKYLEDNVEILDACNYFVEKLENINKYVDTLKVVVHLVDNNNNSDNNIKPNAVAATRALELLESCTQSIEKRSMGKNRGSYCLKKLLRQRLCSCHETELTEIMCGSKAMALMCCRFLELGLSFDSKLGLPTMKHSQPTSSSWLRLFQELARQAELAGADEKKLQKRKSSCSSLLMTVIAARELREQMKGKREKEMKPAVERLKRSCRELEDGIQVIEGRVKDLYRSLIDVRMILLGILSQVNYIL